MVKLTHSKGRINWGLLAGGLIGTVVPVIVTAVTGGVGAVTIPMWVALAAGNVEPKTKVERALDADAAKAKPDGE